MNINKPKLTGRRRYRTHRTGFMKRKEVLILQVEVKGLVASYTGGPDVDVEHQTWWVDAKPEWLMSRDVGEQGGIY